MSDQSEDVDPRVVLAQERTFLAWHRTALALTAGAIALAGFADSGSDAGPRVAALGIIVFAGVIALMNDRQRRRSIAALRRGDDLPPTILPVVLTAGILVIAVTALLLVAGGIEFS